LHLVHRTITAALGGASLIATMLFVSAPALAISVQINGNVVALNPTPIERAGRVFVPLRGVFEQLGANVVYSNGQINATNRRHTISLNIGSTQATVDGQPQTLDVAPFIIGASTYVPLRFVSQALGAQVNWDDANQLASVTSYGVGGPEGNAPLPPTSGMQLLRNEQPLNGAVVRSMEPQIAARFNQNVDPNSLRIRLDGVDITAAVSRTQNGFEYLPTSPLQATVHTVSVRGRDMNGQQVNASWTFTTEPSRM
jgi:Copper amine oxidase N-terminal domain